MIIIVYIHKYHGELPPPFYIEIEWNTICVHSKTTNSLLHGYSLWYAHVLR